MSLGLLGALNPPTRIDDAYALVGVKGEPGEKIDLKTQGVPCLAVTFVNELDHQPPFGRLLERLLERVQRAQSVGRRCAAVRLKGVGGVMRLCRW